VPFLFENTDVIYYIDAELLIAQKGLIQKALIPSRDMRKNLAADSDFILLRRQSRSAEDANRPRRGKAVPRQIEIQRRYVSNDSAIEKVAKRTARAFGNIGESRVGVSSRRARKRERVTVRSKKYRLAGIGNADNRRIERCVREAIENAGVYNVDVRVLRVHGDSPVSERLV